MQSKLILKWLWGVASARWWCPNVTMLAAPEATGSVWHFNNNLTSHEVWDTKSVENPCVEQYKELLLNFQPVVLHLSQKEMFISFIDFINPDADRSWPYPALEMQPDSFPFLFVLLFYQKRMYWHTQFIRQSEACTRPGTSLSFPRARTQLLNDKLVSEGLWGSRNRNWAGIWISVPLLLIIQFIFLLPCSSYSTRSHGSLTILDANLAYFVSKLECCSQAIALTALLYDTA